MDSAAPNDGNVNFAANERIAGFEAFVAASNLKQKLGEINCVLNWHPLIVSQHVVYERSVRLRSAISR